MTQPLILAIDIGTSSIRAALFNSDGTVLPETLIKHDRQIAISSGGIAELDADKAFRQFVTAIDELLTRSEAIPGHIMRVASCAFWHSLLAIGEDGKPITKTLLWADTRSRIQASVLRGSLDESETHQRTGARFHSSFWPAKLLWIKQNDPAAFTGAAKWVSLSDYFEFKLSNNFQTSVSMASASGIFDQSKVDWDEPLLKFLELKRAQLPEFSKQTFRLNSKFAKRWPRLANAQWLPAIGDGAANNIGSGCIGKTTAALMVGTSCALRVAYRGAPPAKLPGGLWSYRIDKARVIMGGALSDGGGLYSWLRNHLRVDSADDEINLQIAKRSPGSHGLQILPFLFGERSTGYNEDASGTIVGITAATTQVDIIHAALESVAFRFAEVFEQLQRVTGIKQMIASGGAIRNLPVWAQIISDVLGRTITIADEGEASLLGTALYALDSDRRVLQKRPVASQRIVRPNPKNYAYYKKSREQHKELYKLLIDRTQ